LRPVPTYRIVGDPQKPLKIVDSRKATKTKKN
jgi:hypothetical protein